ncbi:hypothetical protein TNCV_3654691 [Trichonephila clavipes]|nr:hypothetical protein TNCV_3654691 [Trichonephila clavipes]
MCFEKCLSVAAANVSSSGSYFAAMRCSFQKTPNARNGVKNSIIKAVSMLEMSAAQSHEEVPPTARFLTTIGVPIKELNASEACEKDVGNIWFAAESYFCLWTAFSLSRVCAFGKRKNQLVSIPLSLHPSNNRAPLGGITLSLLST